MNEVLEEKNEDLLEKSITESEEVIEESNNITETFDENSDTSGEVNTNADIYVENNVEDLERMLGIPASQDDEEEEKEENQEDTVFGDEENSINKEIENCDMKEEENITEEIKTRPVLFSDFMDECVDEFTYLMHSNGSFDLNSIPMGDRKDIKNAVKNPTYVFRYPKFILRDPVLGYSELVASTEIVYKVYFPEYCLSFSVPQEYKKPYSVHFKEFFEDLINRYRPDNIDILYYNSETTITSIKVIETGIIEVMEKGLSHTYILKNKDVSFYEVLAYIRELSDMGDDTLSLKLIPAYFDHF